MQDAERLEKLEALLRATKDAHFEAFRHTNGEDLEWPDWYAAYLIGPLGKLLSLDLKQDTLSRLLVAADETQRTQAPTEDWVPFYARFLLQRLRPMASDGPRG